MNNPYPVLNKGKKSPRRDLYDISSDPEDSESNFEDDIRLSFGDDIPNSMG